MELACTLTIVNRLGVANGVNSKCRPLKCVIHLVNGPIPQMSISNNKVTDGRRFEIRKIKMIRKNFIQEGKLTIEFNEPTLNLMIRDSTKEKLERFLQGINILCDYKSQLNPSLNDGPENTNPVGRKSSENEPAQKKPKLEIGEGIKNIEDLKDFRVGLFFTEGRLGRMKQSDVQKTIKNNSTSVSCKNNATNYPKSFSDEIQKVFFENIGLRKIDPKILKLKHLSILEITKNKLTSVDCLGDLSCSLNRLILNENQISSIRDDLFDSAPLNSLSYLDLSNNELKKAPKSIFNIPFLATLILTNNQLTGLPFQIEKLKYLLKLKVDKNRLNFIPSSIKNLNLTEFDCFGNCLDVENKNCKKFAQDAGFPSLFALAGECVAQTARNLPGLKEEIKTVPEIIIEHLDYSISCFLCRKLKFLGNYIFFPKLVANSDIAASVTANGLITVHTPICFKCASSRADSLHFS